MIKRILTLAALATTFLATSAQLPSAEANAQEEYLGQVMLVGFNFCPRGTVAAEGQLLPIASNSALFSLYGTIYGGDGRTTFALPDLRGRSPISMGQGPGLGNYPEGRKGGSETFTVTSSQYAESSPQRRRAYPWPSPA